MGSHAEKSISIGGDFVKGILCFNTTDLNEILKDESHFMMLDA